MTLDEAIKHCMEIAHNTTCVDCKNEHLQLAEWLLELKGRREKNGVEDLKKAKWYIDKLISEKEK